MTRSSWPEAVDLGAELAPGRVDPLPQVKAQLIKKHKEDIGSQEMPKQIYNNNKKHLKAQENHQYYILVQT